MYIGPLKRRFALYHTAGITYHEGVLRTEYIVESSRDIFVLQHNVDAGRLTHRTPKGINILQCPFVRKRVFWFSIVHVWILLSEMVWYVQCLDLSINQTASYSYSLLGKTAPSAQANGVSDPLENCCASAPFATFFSISHPVGPLL